MGVPLIPWKAVRIGLAVLFFIASGFGPLEVLRNIRVARYPEDITADARNPQAIWEFWYIEMLISFVAAVTCALAALRRDGAGDDQDQVDGVRVGAGDGAISPSSTVD